MPRATYPCGLESACQVGVSGQRGEGRPELKEIAGSLTDLGLGYPHPRESMGLLDEPLWSGVAGTASLSGVARRPSDGVADAYHAVHHRAAGQLNLLAHSLPNQTSAPGNGYPPRDNP
jgi:hypothetical protein